MPILSSKSALLLTLLAAATAPVAAESTQSPAENAAAYVRVTNERADKIVATLGLAEAAQSRRVRDLIAGQYRALSAIQETRDARIKAAKGQPDATKGGIVATAKAATAEADAKVEQLHRDFLAQLSAELTPAQVELVKDGMTYGVLPLTFRVYQQMLPNLTAEQRQQILAWLTEAREHAMDGFTSEEKHAWFGKYKGRINNYLSKAGYNMKDAEKNLAKKP
jgi:hypothetical protein